MCSYVTAPKERVYGTCEKCNDRFLVHWGGRSERTPCRFHSWDQSGKCSCCEQDRANYSGNCYHIRADPVCLSCIVS